MAAPRKATTRPFSTCVVGDSSRSWGTYRGSHRHRHHHHQVNFFTTVVKTETETETETTRKRQKGDTKKEKKTTNSDAEGDRQMNDNIVQQQSLSPASSVPRPITNFSDISRAMVAIKTGIRRTSCVQSYYLSELCHATIYLKPEQQQFTGSFKERGARYAILQLIAAAEVAARTEDTTEEGGGSGVHVIAASAGNHALALAYHGQDLGVPVTVVMPTRAPMVKVDRCRQFGATILLHGEHIGEAKAYAEHLVATAATAADRTTTTTQDPQLPPPLTYINGYDDHDIVAGAGTIGIEIIEDVPDVDIVVIPVGGAGLIAGVSCAIKTLRPHQCRVIGVEPDYCPSYTAAIHAGRPVPVPVRHTLADGLAVPQVGAHAYQVATQYVDECVVVDEQAISIAVLRLIEQEKQVVEGAGATGLAAVLPGGPLHGRADIVGKTIVIPLCGGNIDTTVLGRVLERGLAADHRLVDFYAEVSDRPGGIAKFAKLLHAHQASIKDIFHERAWLHTSVDHVRVHCIVELNGRAHAERVKQALLDAGYPILWQPQKQQ